MRKILFFAIVLILIAGIGVATSQAQFFMENSLVGEKAPGFELNDLRGSKQDFSKLSEGKDTIIFFWATWCPHCRAQLKELNQKAAQLKSDGVALVLVDLGEDAGRVEGYLQKNKMDFLVLLDAEGTVSESYQVLGIPTFVLIDKSGTVRSVEHALPGNYKSIFLASDKK